MKLSIRFRYIFKFICQVNFRNRQYKIQNQSMISKFQLSIEQAKVVNKKMPKNYKIVAYRQNTVRQNKQFLERKSEIQKQQSQQKSFKNLTEEQKKALNILTKLKKNEFGSLFKQISATPGYEHIDLDQIENHIRQGISQLKSYLQGTYMSILQFWADIQKIWKNSYSIHPPDSYLYNATLQAENYFNELYSKMDQPPQLDDLQQKVEQLTNEMEKVTKQQLYYQIPTKKKKLNVKNIQLKPMTTLEKRNLGLNIRLLPTRYFKRIWDIVGQSLGVDEQEDQVQFDLDVLDTRTQRELERYVNDSLIEINQQ